MNPVLSSTDHALDLVSESRHGPLCSDVRIMIYLLWSCSIKATYAIEMHWVEQAGFSSGVSPNPSHVTG